VKNYQKGTSKAVFYMVQHFIDSFFFGHCYDKQYL